MVNLNIRRGKNGNTEQLRKIINYLKINNYGKLKKEIIEGTNINKDYIGSCINFLKYLGIIIEKRDDRRRVFKLNMEEDNDKVPYFQQKQNCAMNIEEQELLAKIIKEKYHKEYMECKKNE